MGCLEQGKGQKRGAMPPPQKLFDFFVLKCNVLVHFCTILSN